MRRPVVGFDSPWSEITSEYLADFKEQYGSIAYARAYELRPLSDEDTPIRAEWIKYTIPHEIEVPSLYRYLGADLAFKSKRENDFTVFCDVGRTMAGDLILLRVLRLKQPFAIVQEAVKKWIGNVRYYGIQIDAHGQQEELARQLVEWTGTSIVYDTRPEDKMTRASRLGVPIERGEFHMIGEAGIVSPEQKIVFDEITQFPVASHDDCMDALAYAVEIALKDRSFERMGSISVGNDDDDYVGRRSYGDYDPT